MELPLSRRALLIRAGGVAAAVGLGLAAADAGLLPRPGLARSARASCGAIPPLPAVAPGPVEYGTFASQARGRTVGYAVSYPPGARAGDDLPLCLYLHGRGGSHRNVADQRNGLPWYLADRVAAGAPPMALLAVDGGDNWWHPRRSGDDPARMLTDEVLPLAARRGLRTDAIGLLGTSMGGYGSLLLAERLGPARVRAVGAMSPALYRAYADAMAGAFDSEADFAAHDVFAGRDRLAGIAVHIVCGSDDRYGFADACEAFLAGAPSGVTGVITAGCHDTAYWRAVVPEQLDRIARTLA